MKRAFVAAAGLVVVAACGGRSKSLTSSEDGGGRAGAATAGTSARAGAGASGRGGASGTGGAQPKAGTGGGDEANGGDGFLGVGGTTTSGSGGSSGAPLTGFGGTAGSAPKGGAGGAGGAAGGTGGLVDEAGSGGDAGAPFVPSCVVHVARASGDDANDGRSWDQAVASLARGLDLATRGCEVWVASGTYVTTTGVDRLATFEVPDGVTIRGGFDGSEEAASERVFTVPLPVLSGNIGDPTSARDDAIHVVMTLGAATLDHLDISRGYADGADGDVNGAAVYGRGPLELDGCAVHDAFADGDGGGVFANGPLTVKSSTFTANSSGSGNGGAIAVNGGVSVSVTDSVFSANSAALNGAALDIGNATAVVSHTTFEQGVSEGGAGIQADLDSNLSLSWCNFESNVATDGSAVGSEGTVAMENSTFTDDVSAVDQGVVTVRGALTVEHCDFLSNQGSALLVLTGSGNCGATVAYTDFAYGSATNGSGISALACPVDVTASSFAHDRVTGDGAGIYADGNSAGLSVSGSTFQDEAADQGGAIYADALTLTSDDFVANGASNGGAVVVTTSATSITDCRFLQNDAAVSGGGLLTYAPADIVSTVLAQNTAEQSGGALAYLGTGLLRLTNVTVADNVAAGDAAVAVMGTILVENSIFWHDTAADFALANGLTSDSASMPNLFASNLSGTYPNLTSFDPLFVGPTYGNYRLSDGSPCIDHADDARAPLTDLLGNARVDEHANTPCPSCTGIADMGAYEYGY
ncbi:MAG TPA: right-handed parallel beta-helix repeat-containing protein [Polyangiaceae bacterium]|nr:right-handed parallel beta-helix repeat-containing protein [Polyangiaceae bacterium]